MSVSNRMHYIYLILYTVVELNGNRNRLSRDFAGSRWAVVEP